MDYTDWFWLMRCKAFIVTDGANKSAATKVAAEKTPEKKGVGESKVAAADASQPKEGTDHLSIL